MNRRRLILAASLAADILAAVSVTGAFLATREAAQARTLPGGSMLSQAGNYVSGALSGVIDGNRDHFDLNDRMEDRFGGVTGLRDQKRAYQRGYETFYLHGEWHRQQRRSIDAGYERDNARDTYDRRTGTPAEPNDGIDAGGD